MSAPPHSKRLRAAIALAFLLLVTGCRKLRFPDDPAGYREYAYVTSGDTNSVSVLDLVDMRQDRTLRVGANPTGVTRKSSTSGSISVIDTQTNAVTATIPVHKLPYFLSVDTEGKRGYVANAGSNTVSVLDLATHKEIATAGTGEQPGLARVSPDGRTLVVSNRGSGSISVYNLAQNPNTALARRTSPSSRSIPPSPPPRPSSPAPARNPSSPSPWHGPPTPGSRSRTAA